MKLFWFLTSIVFVDVSTDDLTDYKREVIITNAHIEQAYYKNNFTVGDKTDTNGLEHVIINIIDTKEYDTCFAGMIIMNIMIAVPEHYAYISDLEGAKDIQIAMQNEIKRIDVPEVSDQTLAKFDNIDLEQLGEERRRLTGKALKNMMIHALDFENMTGLIEKRKIFPTELVKNRIVRYADSRIQESPLLRMCRLIALFMTTKTPTAFIKSVLTGSKRTCCLTDVLTTSKTYREIDGVWWQVSTNAIDDRLQLLKKEL
ncbi:uncharacterized protein LOC126847456 isoform X2 [Adelges cooleyi]|uniref:uncharacterized protein LOC126847456 isoform X2 n=1 Tax=Adelges cooleyi TaxID=133065 RepID=UPI002180498B|nr:uncharacterized protein LOC126847456 isoform X2 [Adelges cooleyi]